MKKFLFFIPVILLIVATTITKNSTKKLDKEIFEIKENIRVLEDKYELVLLDFNYLTSPKKLMEYQKLYFDSELIQNDIENLNWMKIKNDQIEIGKIANNE
jgi:hypothetical protein|tara:strand:+ start:22 stop:324 length:303 start_codon:yes stop_codon:yes gene_type:complete